MRKILLYILVFIFICFLLYLISPYYVQKALIHLKPGIGDYRFFQNNKVESGIALPWHISRAYNQFSVSAKEENEFARYQTVAYLVVRNDSILFEKYWENYGRSSLSGSFSVAKSIIGLLVGCALDEGKINSLDQHVSEFLPEFGLSPNDKKLTIRHLLTMSSGLNWGEKYDALFSETTEAYYGNDLKKLIDRLHVVEAPGREFRYLSCNPQILSFILEKVTGKSISEYASEKLWKPMGAEFPAYWSLDKKGGNEKAYCCFNSNARDFARLGQLILNKGQWNGKQIVSEKYINESIAGDSMLTDKDGSRVDYYGYQWWIFHYRGYKIPYARGILGQYVIVIPGKNAVIVRLGKKRGQANGIHPSDLQEYIEMAMGILDKK